MKDKHEKVMENLVPVVFRYIAEQVIEAILVFDVRGKVMYANHAASNVYGHSTDEFQSLSIHDLYSPKDRHRIDEHMKAAEQKIALHKVAHVGRDGKSFQVEISFCSASFGENEVLISIAQALHGEKKETLITGNENQNQLLHEELLAAYEELTASEEELRQQFDELLVKEEKIYRQNTLLNLLHDTAKGLMADLDHEDVFKKIIYGIRELFDTPNSFVYYVNEETRIYTLKIGTGVFSKLPSEGEITKGIIGQAYRTGKAAVVDNYSSWSRRLTNPIFDELHYFVLVPLKNREKMIGAIGLAFSESDRILDEEEFFLLERFVDLAALALSNALLVASLHNEIKERKQKEKELGQSEEKFSKSFQMSPSAIAIARMDGTYVDVNENFCKSTGYPKEELIGKTRAQIGLWLNEEDKGFLTSKLKEQGEVNNLEAWFLRKDGGKVCGLMSARVVTINGEQCVLSITHDITEQKKIKEELKLSEEKFSQAFYLSPDIITISRMDGTYVDVNEGFVRISGFSKEEAIGEKAMNLGLWQEQWTRDHMVEMQKNHGEIRNMEIPFRCKDGHIIYGQLSGCMITLDGEPCYMVVVRDITARVQAEKERRQQAETIKHMAYFDLLTGLANRHHLNEWLNNEMERARAGKASGVILFIDLDDLKMINDTYGHSYGDKIISAAGARVVDGAGEEAFVARIGGDEFVVILSGQYDRGQIEKIAHKISKALGKKQEILGRRFHMTASIGIASYPTDGDTTEEIIKNADNAMYAAKRDNKNCWRFYTEAMQTEAYKKIQLTGSLRYALERGELSIVYQPQIHTNEKTVIGFEALLRWNSAEYGAVSPMHFIPLAEQSGLIHSIGQWVLREACQFARRLDDRGWNGVRVAVNISSKQIAADDFIAIIRSAIKEAGIQPCQLELEITESVLMTSLEDATSKLAELKDFGVHLSLDDFGTGFSSLTYLRRLPVESLKIDKSFIDMITTDAQGAKIIGSIINMAHTIHMNVVAEGVENELQLKYLADNGCDLIQGYLYSRPIPEDEAMKFLAGKAC
ncbi:MAG: hypothetical protein K0Q53_907 [Massilibacillus sp.]|jgi:diguanylate cyclase (GGDEF)-like protein/PAS domain S-box-containing protein|nr:hypothetical protein [Massilibacillus sp.]